MLTVNKSFLILLIMGCIQPQKNGWIILIYKGKFFNPFEFIELSFIFNNDIKIKIHCNMKGK